MAVSDLKHYYVDDQKELTNRKEISFRFLDIDYNFITADSIFSKDRVDYGTTLLLKESLKAGFKDKVLDYGCGYGVVATVLSKHDHEVVAIDVTDRAVKLSEINAKNNKVNFKVEKIKNNNVDMYKSLFNTVLLNPPIRAGKKVIYQMFENVHGFLLEKGELYIVIRKQHGAKSAIKKLETLFKEVKVLNKSKGYWIIKSKKV